MSLKDKEVQMGSMHTGYEHYIKAHDVDDAVKELKQKLGCHNPKEDDAHGNITEGIIEEVFGKWED